MDKHEAYTLLIVSGKSNKSFSNSMHTENRAGKSTHIIALLKIILKHSKFKGFKKYLSILEIRFYLVDRNFI